MSSTWKWAGETVEEIERELIRQAFESCDGNIQKTARLVGMSRANMYRRLKELDLYPRRKTPDAPTSVKKGASGVQSE